ncbi:hypothetical protein [Melittangium boletus]|uniref:Uncharacterized protein n=1 Tax=Melittangium boletus DSM 14713 TaxID=1294270 RepID=A0A250IER1_9BACT|nr:hypothetical protein [Melittangium boletus]ATB29631.1 hypothetical protein MEBOL_003086 [Melittangium boletus DSM 14713]
MSQQKPRKPLSAEQIRAKVLEDPDSKRIAKAVGLDLAAYADKVVDYAMNPDKEPQLQVASDEALRAAGYDPPSAEDVGKFFLAGANGELGLETVRLDRSGFDASPNGAGKPSLSGTEGQKQATVDSAKSQELMDQVRKGGGRIN